MMSLAWLAFKGLKTLQVCPQKGLKLGLQLCFNHVERNGFLARIIRVKRLCGGIVRQNNLGWVMTTLRIPHLRRFRRATLSLAAALALFAMPVFAQAVSQIIVQGNQRVEAETVRAYLTIKPGEAYSAAKVDESLKALYATGLFSDVKINRTGSGVIVSVVENPAIDRVAFEGNKKNDDDELLKEIESKPNTTYTRAKAQSDAQRLTEVYRRQGRFDVRVEPKVIELPENRVNVVYEVTEGEKTKVEKISFIGNNAFSDYKLRDVITTTESNWLSFLKSSDVYDPERLTVDQELLRRHYLKNGYADFRVISAVADYDRAKNAFFITFTLEEGQPYRFGAINIDSSIANVNAEDYRSYIKSHSGATYNAELIDKTLESIGVEIARRGYPFAQVRPRGDRDPANNVVNVSYMIEEGPRLYVERINISNNTRTQDRVIRREIDLSEGDAYNRVMADRAEKRLNRLGYFKKVNITREPGSAPDRVVMNVDVEEQSTGDLGFGAGYSTNEGFIGDVSITERNFLGRGQYAKAALGLGERRQRFDLSFTEPYFFDRRLSVGADAFYRRVESSSISSFEQESYGGALRLGMVLTDELTAQARLTGYQQNISIDPVLTDCSVPVAPAVSGVNDNEPSTGPGDPIGNGVNDCLDNGEASIALRQAEGTATIGMIGGGLVYNALDNVRNPSEGYFAQGNVDVASVSGNNALETSPGSGVFNENADFMRVTAEARAYYPVYGDFVGMLKVQGGTMSGFNSNDDVRIVDTFFKGGEFIRGFEPSGIGPREATPGFRNDALGGKTYIGGTAELQFPIPFAPEEMGFKGALFADAGTLYDVGQLPSTYVQCTGANTPAGCNFFDDSSLRASVGLSLIWQGSPLGPIRFDFGFPIAKEDYDETQVFRFGGGTTF